MKYIAYTLLIFSFIASFFFSKALACSCSEITAAEMLNSEFNEYIFIGTVTSAKLMKHKGVYSYINADVNVEERFKGAASDRNFTVHTSLFSASCGGSISVGERYIFVTAEKGFFNFCTSMSIAPHNLDNRTRVYIEDFRAHTTLK